jgi:hypothetical protein
MNALEKCVNQAKEQTEWLLDGAKYTTTKQNIYCLLGELLRVKECIKEAKTEADIRAKQEKELRETRQVIKLLQSGKIGGNRKRLRGILIDTLRDTDDRIAGYSENPRLEWLTIEMKKTRALISRFVELTDEQIDEEVSEIIPLLLAFLENRERSQKLTLGLNLTDKFFIHDKKEQTKQMIGYIDRTAHEIKKIIEYDGGYENPKQKARDLLNAVGVKDRKGKDYEKQLNERLRSHSALVEFMKRVKFLSS